MYKNQNIYKYIDNYTNVFNYVFNPSAHDFPDVLMLFLPIAYVPYIARHAMKG